MSWAVRCTLPPDEAAVYYVAAIGDQRGEKATADLYVQAKPPLTAEERAHHIDAIASQAIEDVETVLQLREENRLQPILSSLQSRGLIAGHWTADTICW